MEVYTWGLDPTKLKTKEQKCILPKIVPSLTAKHIIQVACGSHFNAALARDGSVYTWGVGARGRLGHNSEEDKTAPTKVKGLEGHKIVKLACGSWHMGGVSESGALFLWGSTSKSYTSFVPVKVLDNVVSFGCGQQWTCTVLANGNLVIIDKQGKNVVYEDAKFENVWCGSDFGAAVDNTGAVWVFGTKIEPNIYANTKRPEKKAYGDFIPPVKLDLILESPVRKCVCNTGEFHQSIGVVLVNGNVHMWGSNYKGKLGVGDFEDRAVPTRINLENVIDMEIGGIHAAIIGFDRQLLTFGCGSDALIALMKVGWDIQRAKTTGICFMRMFLER